MRWRHICPAVRGIGDPVTGATRAGGEKPPGCRNPANTGAASGSSCHRTAPFVSDQRRGRQGCGGPGIASLRTSLDRRNRRSPCRRPGVSGAEAAERRVPTPRPRCGFLCADREARCAGRGQRLRRKVVQTATRFSTIRSSGASSAAGLRRPQVQRSLGSGVIVDPSGIIVTNITSSTAPTRSRWRSPTSASSRPTIVLKDKRTDLAVLRSRTRSEVSRPSTSPIPTRCRSATSCSPSAIRSASARR